jgi:hypothetical protein
MDFPEEMGPEGHFKIPVMTLGALPGQSHEPTPHSINDDWVAYFGSLINQHDSDRPRILLLESCSTMSSTLPIWWPSFAEAVRSRRRKARATPGRRNGSKPTVWDLVKPTSIVLSFAPSMLSSHTANSKPGQDEEIWWGSEESDAKGRQHRDASRLEALRASNLEYVLSIHSGSFQLTNNQCTSDHSHRRSTFLSNPVQPDPGRTRFKVLPNPRRRTRLLAHLASDSDCTLLPTARAGIANTQNLATSSEHRLSSSGAWSARGNVGQRQFSKPGRLAV